MPSIAFGREGTSGFVSWFKSKLERKSSLAAPEAWLAELFSAVPVASGVAVTPVTAMTCAPVACAVRAISEAVEQLPLITYERKDDGGKDRAIHHPVYRLLHDQANEWTGAGEIRGQLVRDALLWDNGGFAFINRVEGRPVELIRLTPGTVSVEIANDGGPIYKARQSDGNTRIYPRENIFHVRAAYVEGFGGKSPTTLAREAIGLALIMEGYASRLFGNGARPSGVLKLKDIRTPEGLSKAKTSWNSAHGGSKSGGTAVIQGDADWQQITLNSVDAQFLELRTFAISEIARAYRVPPILLQDYGRATWSNSEAMGQQFLTYCLLPWLKRIEAECRLKLFSEAERDTFLAEFLIDDLLRADFEKRMEGYSKAIAARVLNPNEARAAENRAAYAGGEAFINPNTTANAGGPNAAS